MLKGKLVFAQLKEHLPRSVFDRCVARYAGSHAPLKFSHWDQLLCMMFAQLTSRASLRDIAPRGFAVNADAHDPGRR